ncbi:hypothetical protein GJU43_12345 [Flavobacterium sp. LC2016-23]|uniref:hypothetical protein n=1 Tax=Flavobacterium sp. LC2016-23 TaxID=2666330 RepID=UPI0012B0E8CB|nr:hypothetical protein [Flavobacterium sp. LC2016-23]MRX40068.1 hypothetical protein [Flavobacterium sp. LC2016-23]
MKKNILIIMLCLSVLGCKRKEGLELEIINKSILSLVPEDKNTYNNMDDSLTNYKSKTIIVFKLTNYDCKSYYFNLNYFGKLYSNLDGLTINQATIYFYKDNRNKEEKVKVRYGHPNFNLNPNSISNKRNVDILKMLNYSTTGNEKYFDNSNFIIHSNETLYFEGFVNLPYGDPIQNAHVDFDKNAKYSAEITMFSDSTNYKKMLSRPILRTIQKNGYQVYHGVIKSKNRVSIKFIE